MHSTPIVQPTRSDIALGLFAWLVATGLITVVVGPTLPGPSDGASTLFTYVIACAATLAGSTLLAVGWARLTHQRLDSGAGLRLGAALLIGLFLDGVVVAALGFGYPRVSTDQTATITIAFLLAYPLAVAGPWAAGWWLESRRTVPWT